MLIPPQKGEMIKDYYQSECERLRVDTTPARVEPIVDACRRKFEGSAAFAAAAAAAPTQLMIGRLSYGDTIRSMSRRGIIAGGETSQQDLAFARLALQKSSIPLTLVPTEMRFREAGFAAFHIPTPLSESPKEVWHGDTATRLRWDGGPNSSDDDANHCYGNMERTDLFFRGTFSTVAVKEPSTHNRMISFVHEPSAINNAFWYPGDHKVHCGDADPLIFASSFGANPEIIVHEFGHAVTYYSSNLDYRYQSGAINESLSDVFAITEKHRKADVKAQDPAASWNLCEGFIVGAREGSSLRSMSAPGTGYKGHPILGDDDQVGHMDDYQREPLSSDCGGVHKYSGIANHAFYFAATQDAGDSWERMGRIWHLALTRSRHDIDFAGFAHETVRAVKDLKFGDAIEQIVASSWSQVGVLTGMAPPPSATGTPPKASEEPPQKRTHK